MVNSNPWHTRDNGEGNSTGSIPPDAQSIQRRWHFYPIYTEDILGTNITCNWDGASTSQSLHAPIAAGSNITAYYDTRDFNLTEVSQQYWVHAHGPLMAYMARCPGDSCAGFDGSGAVWFKVAQYGLEPLAENLGGPWYHWDMIGSVGKPGFVVTIPKDLKAGAYLIRHEVLMLASNPAQFYPECSQLMVTGDGTKLPSEKYLVSFPGAYQPTG